MPHCQQSISDAFAGTRHVEVVGLLMPSCKDLATRVVARSFLLVLMLALLAIMEVKPVDCSTVGWGRTCAAAAWGCG